MTTTFDNHKDLAYSAVATPPSPATTGTSLTVTTGDGTKFPAAPFNATVWPGGGATASQANAEEVRVTGVATDTFTIVRGQGGTTAQSIAAGYLIALTGMSKLLTDIEAAVNATLGGALSGTLPNPGIAAGAVGTAQLALGAVDTTQLAAGAVTQRPATVIGVSVSPTTTSTTDVDLPDMAVTLTTTGGDLLCLGGCVVGNSTSATGNVYITLYLDGTQKGMASLATPGIGTWDTVMVHDMLAGVASGAHTVKLRWHTDGGTAVANGIQRALTVIEMRR